MAGVAGMGTPSRFNQIGNQEPVQASPLPPVQAQPARPSLDEIYSSSQASPDRPSLDQLFADTQGDPEKGFVDKMLDASNAGGIQRGFVKGAQHTIEGLISIPTAIGDAVSSKVTTGEGDIGNSVIQGFKNPDKLQPLDVSLEKIFPSMKGVKIQLPTSHMNTDLYASPEDYGIQNLGSKPYDTGINVSKALAIAADIEGGNVVIKGMTKAAGVAKLAAIGLDGAIARRNASRVAEAGSKAAEELIPKMDLAQQKVQDLVHLSDELTKSGLVKNIDGFNTPIMPSQVDLNNPASMAKAVYLADEPAMQSFILKQQDMIDDGMKSLLESTTTYKRTEGAVDIPLNTIVRDTLRNEGSSFAATRLKALKTGGDVHSDASSFHSAIDELGKELGFNIIKPVEKIRNYYPGMTRNSAMNPVFEAPTIDSLIARGYSREGANTVITKMTGLKELLSGYTKDGVTRMPFKVIAKEYNLLRKEVSGLWDGGINVDKGYRLNMTRLKGNFQEVYDAGVGKILGGAEQEKYMAEVAKYSQVKTLMADMSKITENEMGSTALSRYTFQNANSASSISRVEGMQQLLDLAGKPQAFDNLVGNFVHESIRANTGRFGKEMVTKWGKVVADIDKLDPAVKEIMFGKKINLGYGYNKSGAEAINDMASFYDAVERGTPAIFSKSSGPASVTKSNGIKAMASAMEKGPVDAAYNVTFGKISDVFIQSNKDAAMAKFLSREGIEDVLKTVPKERREALKKFTEKYIERANKWEKIKAKGGG